MTKLNEFMPEKKEKVLVQAQIDQDLHDEIQRILDSQKWKWPDLIRALLKKFLVEKKRGVK